MISYQLIKKALIIMKKHTCMCNYTQNLNSLNYNKIETGFLFFSVNCSQQQPNCEVFFCFLFCFSI